MPVKATGAHYYETPCLIRLSSVCRYKHELQKQSSFRPNV